MSNETGSFHNHEVSAPTPEMLHQLTRVAIEYGLASDKLESAAQESTRSIYYLKDFQIENGTRVGRVARFSRAPLFEVEFEDDEGKLLTGVGSAYSFYYSERVEYEGHGLREEWQAFGYRWNDNGEVERAARWVETHPSLEERPRSKPLSTASDVTQLIHGFKARQHDAGRAA
jgi:hypothetical protein